MTPRHSRKVVSDINVTNLVDVTMVLLIVFILLAPVIESGIDLNLPEASSQKVDTPQDVVNLSVSKTGVLYWNREVLELTDLAERIRAAREKKGDIAVLLRGDTDVSYGQMVKVLDILRNMGVHQLDIATQVEEKA
ncbi:MAG: biopolymer transporter ExbD [Chlamydiae bacterium]|nr:biopolymer transporter ExbD [Chlamydiota bacterium]MBI3278180.1 biopolymer transporter ExbD [Chlamydiota bacterium]